MTLPDAAGRVIAEDVAARRTQPPFALSAMDGYAVRAADLAVVPTRLTVVGCGAGGAGLCRHVSWGPGEGGAHLLPARQAAGGRRRRRHPGGHRAPGATASKSIREASPLAAMCSARRDRFHPGNDIGLRAGQRLTARDVGLAAAMNRPWLMVGRRPRVAILPTGDEVAMPGEPVGPHQIVSSNGLALGALVAACGGVPVQLGIAPDDASALRRLAAGAAGVDLLVTSGGASVGDHDLVRDALGESGLVIDFWQIAMRPGKPLMVGRLRDTPMIGLPGNPVSTLVCGLLFVKPAIERLQGLLTAAEPPLRRAARRGARRANDRRQDYLRATLSRIAEGGLEAHAPSRSRTAPVISRPSPRAGLPRGAAAPRSTGGDRRPGRDPGPRRRCVLDLSQARPFRAFLPRFRVRLDA